MPNPACFFDITIDKKPAGRICFEASYVFYQDAPCRMIQCHRLIEQKHNILNVWEHHIYIYSFIFWRSDGLSQSFMCNSHLISFQLYSINLLTCYYTSVQRLTYSKTCMLTKSCLIWYEILQIYFKNNQIKILNFLHFKSIYPAWDIISRDIISQTGFDIQIGRLVPTCWKLVLSLLTSLPVLLSTLRSRGEPLPVTCLLHVL